MKNIKHLSAKEQRFENIIEATELGTWEWEVQTGKLVINDAWAKIIGYDLDELSPSIDTWKKYTHPDDLKTAEKTLERVFSKELPHYEFELRMKHKNGDWIWILDKGKVISWSSDDKPLLMVGSHTDISKIKETNEKLEKLLAKEKKSEMLLRSSIESPKDMIILAIDNKYNYLYFNETHKESMRIAYGKNVKIGMNILECITSKIDKINSKKNYDLALSGVSHSTIQEYGDKKISYFESHYNPIYGLNNEIIGATAFARDISQTKKLMDDLRIEHDKAQNYLDVAGVMLLALDNRGVVTLINHKGCEILEANEEDILGKNWFDNFLPKAIIEDVRIVFRNMIEQKIEIASHFENKVITAKGKTKIINWYNTVLYDAEKNISGLFSSGEDITQHRETQDSLRLSERNLKMAQSIAKIGSWELELKDNFIWASEEAFDIYDLERDNGYIELAIIQKMVSLDERELLNQALQALILNGKPYDVTFKIYTKHGVEKYINSKASLFFDAENKPIKVIGVIHDITDLKHKELELKSLSQRDYLTNLYNRRYYFEQFKQLDQPKYYPLGVMMLDVNGLKIINDAFGHTAGDEALKMIGNTLKSIFDTKDIISRIGGDEFTILLPNTSQEKLQDYKESIIASVKNQTIENIELSLAIGYELKNSKTEDIDELQKLAENHMYRHKTTEGSSVRSKAINAILVTLTNKYETERRHAAKVSRLCKEIGIALDLRDDEIKELEQAGLYHDIGKISIPDSILNKPAKLTNEEFEIIKTHTEVGYQILRAADEYSDLAIHALHHHERWDGNGYPAGLKGNDIPLFSRIICVVDAYEAMTANRPYRKKLSREYAVSEIKRCSGLQFDPNIAQLFVEKILKKKWL